VNQEIEVECDECGHLNYVEVEAELWDHSIEVYKL
jgi:hypothetical protein